VSNEPESPTEAPKVVLIPFVCPVCAGANAVHLITLSRAGGVSCAECQRWLKSTDVMRAMHSPRATQRADGSALEARRVRPAPQRAPARTWPPTAASRAAAIPLRK